STYGGRLWKYNSSMVSQWVKTAGTRLNGVDADNSGNSYVTGTPPGGGIFVQKYNSAGTAQFGTGYSIVEANADAKEIHVSGGDIYLGGTFYNTANFGFDYDVISLAGETSSSVFWAKYQVDNTAPDVTLTTPVSSPTNQDPVPVTITFSEPVNGFNPNPGDPNNATLGNVVQVNATTFTADLIPSVSSGQIDYTVINGLCTDNHNNYNNSSNTLIIDYDAVAPTVSVSSTAPDPTNMSPIPVTFTFSENVSGFTAGDIVVANGTASNFISVSGSIYTADITPASGGNVSVQVNGNAAQDGASNGNTASNIFSIVYDDVHPAVVIMSTAPDPTSTSPIPVTFTFSENVSGFTVGDIAVTNGTASNFVAVSGTVYTADILPSAQGLVSVDVPAAVCADGATNPNDAATQFSITYQLTTGISGPAGIQPFTVFPNPCTGSFTVRLPGGWTAGTVSVYDVTGRMCFSAGTVTGDHVTLQTGLPAGCYSVEIVSPQSRTILPLIIDQH
ncbi:MAG TPA: Ig-like domain-containing protein, partial [Bacteroidia bacterium]|nr:Ig-like domain-containing protein [Bacteroidia bacterium]